MRVAGIDPSTKTGFVCLDIEDGEIKVVDRAVITFKGKTGMNRIALFHDAMLYWIGKANADLYMMEGYGYSNKHTLVTLVEIGTAIRMALHSAGEPVGIVAPTTLKKFVTGKGNTKKDGMMLSVYKQWGFEGTDDECDAFGLAAMGLYAGNHGINPRLLKTQKDAYQNWHIDNMRLFNMDKRSAI